MSAPNWCPKCQAYRPCFHECDPGGHWPDQVTMLQAQVDILEALVNEHAGEIYAAKVEAYATGYRDGFGDGRAAE